AAWPDGGAPLGLAGWQAAFLGVGLPGLVLALWVLSLREPVRGANEGISSPGDPHPWRGFAAQLMLIVPPFTVLGAARRGISPLAVNLAVAGGLAAVAWVLGRVADNPAQFWFVAIGYYAVFSWACHLQAA